MESPSEGFVFESTMPTFFGEARHKPAPIMICRSASRPIFTLCLLGKYALASVGPKSQYTSCDKMRMIFSRLAWLVFRFDARPRSPMDDNLVALSPQAMQQPPHLPR
jgi:hypothetical protein